MEFLLGKGKTLMPRLLEEEVTATYAGLQATIDHNDYLIEIDRRSALRARRRAFAPRG